MNDGIKTSEVISGEDILGFNWGVLFAGVDMCSKCGSFQGSFRWSIC